MKRTIRFSSFCFWPTVFLLGAGVAAGAAPCVQVVTPTAGGAYVQTGERVDSYLLAGNTEIDYFGGGPKDYRNWLVFRVPAFPGPLVGAELRLPAETTISQSDRETWEVHHVATPVTTLLQPTGNIRRPEVYADLGDGPVYGRATILTSQNRRGPYDAGAPVLVSLSNGALTALTAAQGTNFALGGLVTSQDANTNTPDLVFYNLTAWVSSIELALNFGTAAPVIELVPRAGTLSQPQDFATYLLAGDSMNISSRICGQAPLTLQWLFNGQPISDETNSVLYRSLLMPSDNGLYQLRAANGLGTSTSAPVNVRMEALRVYQQPISRTVWEGEPSGINFTVATLLPTTYEWRRNGVLLPGRNNYYLDFLATEADAGQYQAVARNSSGSITSVVATLTVQLRPPTINFDVPDTVVAAGLSLYLAAYAIGHAPISYQWYRDGIPIPGATNFNYLRDIVGFSDAGVYQVRLTNSVGQASSRPARVTVQAFTAIYGPYDTAAYWGAGASFWVGVNGASPQTFQWYRENVPVPSATNSFLFLSYALPSDAGQYFVIVSNPYGSITSAVARLTVNQSAPTVWANLTTYEATEEGLPHLVLGKPAILTGQVTAGPPAALQWQRNGVDIPGATNITLDFSSLTATDTGDYVLVATNLFGRGLSQPVTIDVVPVPPSVDVWIQEYETSGTLKLPQVAVGGFITFSSNVRGSPPMAIQWERNGVALTGQTNQSLRLVNLQLDDSGQYTLAARNEFGLATSFPITIEVVVEPPYFALIPNAREATVGVTAALRSVAGGSPEIRYQWYYQDLELPAETNATLFLTPQSVGQSGNYVVVASNPAGEARATNAVHVRADGGLDHWRWSLPQPQGSRLKAVSWGNDRYVAVGRSGNVLVSTNGTDWRSVILPMDGHAERVTWGNGRFVATGYVYASTDFTAYVSSVPLYYLGIAGAVFTSVDGEHWTIEELPGALFFDLTFGNGIFVACGSQPRAWVHTSVDGKTWTPQANGLGNAYQVASGNGIFLAAGSSGVYQSTNGIEWSQVPVPGGMNDLTFGNGVFLGTSSVVYGTNTVAAIFTSPDGAAWDTHYMTNFTYLFGITAGGGRYVALAPQQYLPEQKGWLAVSSDLEQWTMLDTGAGQELESATYGGGRFVVVGEAGTLVYSTDGDTWLRLPVANDIDYYGLASNGQRLVAAGDDGTILTSDDGETWTQRATPNSRNLHGAGYGNGLFVTTGRRGLILTSPNGVTWTRRESGVTNYLERVHYANNRWVAVGEAGDLSVSDNGLSWTPLNTGYPFSDHEGIAYGSGMWIVAGGYFDYDDDDGPFAVGTLYSSVDGLTWSRLPYSTGKRLRDIAFAEGRFVAVGNDRQIFTSKDGGPWMGYFLPRWREEDNLRRIIYSQGIWIAVGNDGRMVSTSDPSDPSSWSEHVSHTSQNLHDIIATPDGGYVSVGNNGMLLRSSEPDLRIVNFQKVPGGYELYFARGMTTGPVSLQSSADMQSWNTMATGISNPYLIPSNGSSGGFYRLVSP